MTRAKPAPKPAHAKRIWRAGQRVICACPAQGRTSAEGTVQLGGLRPYVLRDGQAHQHQCAPAELLPAKTGRRPREVPAVRLQLRIPAELGARFAARCDAIQRGQGAVIAELLEQWLAAVLP